MIFKTITDLQGKTTLGTNFGNIKNFFTRQNILSNSDIEAIKAYNKEFTRLSNKVKASTINVSDHIIARKAANMTMEDASKKAKKIVKNAKNSTVALNNLTRSSKAANLGMRALSIAGNMLAGMAAIKVVELLTNLISNYVNEAKIARENTEALSSSLTESQNKYAEDSKKIEALSSLYETLSKGENHLGQNVSLSSSQYDEYKSIVKRLSDIMPDLTLRFNKQGEAIGFVSGKLDDANKIPAEPSRKISSGGRFRRSHISGCS